MIWDDCECTCEQKKKKPSLHIDSRHPVQRGLFLELQPSLVQEVKSKNSKPLLGFSGGAWSTLLYCLFGANERKIISQKLIWMVVI